MPYKYSTSYKKVINNWEYVWNSHLGIHRYGLTYWLDGVMVMQPPMRSPDQRWGFATHRNLWWRYSLLPVPSQPQGVLMWEYRQISIRGYITKAHTSFISLIITLFTGYAQSELMYNCLRQIMFCLDEYQTRHYCTTLSYDNYFHSSCCNINILPL